VCFISSIDTGLCVLNYSTLYVRYGHYERPWPKSKVCAADGAV